VLEAVLDAVVENDVISHPKVPTPTRSTTPLRNSMASSHCSLVDTRTSTKVLKMQSNPTL
jgi:hypothetical protein